MRAAGAALSAAMHSLAPRQPLATRLAGETPAARFVIAGRNARLHAVRRVAAATIARTAAPWNATCSTVRVRFVIGTAIPTWTATRCAVGVSATRAASPNAIPCFVTTTIAVLSATPLHNATRPVVATPATTAASTSAISFSVRRICAMWDADRWPRVIRFAEETPAPQTAWPVAAVRPIGASTLRSTTWWTPITPIAPTRPSSMP